MQATYVRPDSPEAHETVSWASRHVRGFAEGDSPAGSSNGKHTSMLHDVAGEGEFAKR